MGLMRRLFQKEEIATPQELVELRQAAEELREATRDLRSTARVLAEQVERIRGEEAVV